MHLIDVAPTCLDAASAKYPSEMNGTQTTPLEGESLLAVAENPRWGRDQPLFWEHEGSRAVRLGQWKLVAEIGGDWELYDMSQDRTELHDLAGREQVRKTEMARLYDEWAERCGVEPWSEVNPTWAPRMRGHSAHISGPAAPGRR